MTNKKIQQYFLWALVAASALVTFFIFRPFIYIVILASVFATIFHPMHERILRFFRNNHGFSAFLSTVIVIITILVPFLFLGFKIFQEAQEFYFFMINGGGQYAVTELLIPAIAMLSQYIPIEYFDPVNIDQYGEQAVLWVVDNLTNVFGSITKLTFSFFIFIVVTYYLFKDGLRFKKIITHASPLADSDDELIFEKISNAMHSVIKGNLVISVIQGALVSLGFTLFGVPNAMLWGIVATLASFVPGFGTAIVVVPAVIFTFLTRDFIWAFGLLLWGTIIVGLIDNVLKPKFIGNGMKIHPLIIFFAVLGGIIVLGPIGFLVGPLMIGFLFALLDIHISAKAKKIAEEISE